MRQSGPDTALWRADPKRIVGTPEIDLLRSIQHTLRVLAWQNSKAAQQGRDYPEPIRWAWEKQRDEHAGDVMPLDELKARLGWA